MISEGGYQEIVVADDLSPESRIFLYLHSLGHIAHGQIDPRRRTIKYELRNRRGLLEKRAALLSLKGGRLAKRLPYF